MAEYNIMGNGSMPLVAALPTNDTVLAAQVSRAPGIVVSFICAGTIIYNLIILLAFVMNPSIRKPFTYLIMNVAVADLGFAMISMSGFVFFKLSPSTNAAYCSYYNWLDTVFAAGTGYTVLLVSLDRLFSLYLPIQYRNIRSVKFTVSLCAATWICLIAFVTPWIVMDALWYRKNTFPCSANYGAQHTYSLFIEFIAFDIPIWLVLVVYGFIFARLRHRMKLWSVRVAHNGDSTSHSVAVTQVNGQTEPTSQTQRESSRDEKRFHRLMALMALSILICYFPASVFYLLVDFMGYWNDTVYEIVLILEFLSCTFNPVIYHSTLPDLRKALRKLIRQPT